MQPSSVCTEEYEWNENEGLLVMVTIMASILLLFDSACQSRSAYHRDVPTISYSSCPRIARMYQPTRVSTQHPKNIEKIQEELVSKIGGIIVYPRIFQRYPNVGVKSIIW